MSRVEKAWVFEGHRCAVFMMPWGNRCGYVQVKEGHPLFGHSYNEHVPTLCSQLEKIKHSPIGKRGIIPVLIWDRERCSPEIIFDVHGGLTYSGELLGESWWFGFDCEHEGDARDPAEMDEAHRRTYHKWPSFEHGVVRSLEYCVGECESLVKQINDIFEPKEVAK